MLTKANHSWQSPNWYIKIITTVFSSNILFFVLNFFPQEKLKKFHSNFPKKYLKFFLFVSAENFISRCFKLRRKKCDHIQWLGKEVNYFILPRDDLVFEEIKQNTLVTLMAIKRKQFRILSCPQSMQPLKSLWH